jgi:hypothetical protein
MTPAEEMIHHGCRIGRHGHQIDVSDRLAPAAPTPGGLDPLNGRAFAHPSEDLGDDLVGLLPELARNGDFADERQVFEDRCLRLFTETLHGAHPAVPTGFLEGCDRVDAQTIDELLDLLGPEAGHAHQVEHARGNPGRQLVEERQATTLEDRPDLGGEVAADPLEIGERSRAIGTDRIERLDLIGDRPCRGPVRADPERVLPLVLEEISETVEECCDVGVGHGESRRGSPAGSLLGT